MDSKRFERIAELFLEASRLDADQRELFLRKAAEGDPELIAEVLSLLRHDEHSLDDLRTGALLPDVVAAATETPPRIGSYRVIEVLGEGGMGIVYRAEQDAPIRRPVAIKLIRTGLETEQVIARFESERQALALMNHPNIAKVYDAGSTSDGRPYFVMEYVPGEPITDYCDRHGLTVTERLQLFLQVCAGIQHAHQKAVIHRDVTPANILVSSEDGVAIPKIIDFGIAKALGQGLGRLRSQTQHGHPIGTPDYMSPEQTEAGGRDVDTRTDVYSLCVLLYELLTSRRPIDTSAEEQISYEEFCRRIRETQPTRPSARVLRLEAGTEPVRTRGVSSDRLSRALRGDLDWITMKGLEKEPDRRYSSPAELAADIERHLRLEPVLAGPPSVVYKLRTYVRRHRAIAALILILNLATAGFAVVATTQAARIAREAKRADEAADRAESESRVAARITALLIGRFGDASAGVWTRPESRPDTLDQSMRMVRQELADRPVLKAQMLQTIGRTYGRLRLYRSARSVLEEAHDDLARTLGADAPATLETVSDLASIELATLKFEAAEELLTRVLEVRKRTAGSQHPDTFRAMSNLGSLYKAIGRNEEAAQLFQTARDGLEQTLAGDHPDVLACAELLGAVYLDLGRYHEAREILLAIAQDVRRVFGEGVDGILMYNLACAHANLDDPQRALRYLRESIEGGFDYPASILQDPHLRPLHGDPEFSRLERIEEMNNPGNWLWMIQEAKFETHQGNYPRAATLLQRVSTALERKGDTTGLSIAVSVDLADVYLRQRRFDDAEALLRQRLDGVRKHPRMTRENEIASLLALAQCNIGRGEFEQALLLVESAFELESWKKENTTVFAYYEAVRRALRGSPDEALEFLELAASRGYSNATWFSRDLAFESLWGTSRFEAILNRVRAMHPLYAP